MEIAYEQKQSGISIEITGSSYGVNFFIPSDSLRVLMARDLAYFFMFAIEKVEKGDW